LQVKEDGTIIWHELGRNEVAKRGSNGGMEFLITRLNRSGV